MLIFRGKKYTPANLYAFCMFGWRWGLRRQQNHRHHHPNNHHHYCPQNSSHRLSQEVLLLWTKSKPVLRDVPTNSHDSAQSLMMVGRMRVMMMMMMMTMMVVMMKSWIWCQKWRPSPTTRSPPTCLFFFLAHSVKDLCGQKDRQSLLSWNPLLKKRQQSTPSWSMHIAKLLFSGTKPTTHLTLKVIVSLKGNLWPDQ